MEKFLKRKASSSTQSELENLPWDPADRKQISNYHPNQRNEVIRAYLLRGPCQPRGHIFKQTSIGGIMRRFNPAWFDQYPRWLEYSVDKMMHGLPKVSLVGISLRKFQSMWEVLMYEMMMFEMIKQLAIYIDNVRNDEKFTHLESLGELARLLVETRKHMSYPLVFRLLKLILILPVATATVERCFSTMKIVKTERRNQIGDQFLNDYLVCFVEKDLFESITNEVVMKRFQDMKDRRVVL